jgi:hypothetical protein
MDNRVLQIKGAKAAVREMRPVLTIDAVRFASNNMTDAVALTNGRILQWYVGKNSTVSKGDILLSMDNEQIPLKIQDYNTPDETYQILSSEFDCSRYTAFLDMINRFRKAHLSFFFQKDETGKIEEDVVAELPNIGCDYAFYDLIEESGRAFS